jgi:hypothetical protein
MANDPVNTTRHADRALDAAGRNLQQAQERLTKLLAAARLAATVRARRMATPASPRATP